MSEGKGTFAVVTLNLNMGKFLGKTIESVLRNLRPGDQYVVESDGHIAPVPVAHRMDCFGCNWQCTQTHVRDMAFPCILRITVHEVFQAFETITKK